METEFNAGVYCIINLINNKKYAGSSSTSIKRRWSRHKRDLKNGRHDNPYLQREFNKYGEDAFDFRVLIYTKPEEALALEQWILDNYFYLFEYNISRDATAPMLGRHHSEQTKAKIREANSGEGNPNFGTHLSEETRNKISASISGEKHPNFDKHLSENTRRKIGEAHMGENNHNFGKPLNEETKAKISQALIGREFSEEHKQKLSASITGNKHPRWINISKDKIVEMQSLREQGYYYYQIADIFGVSVNTVWKRLNNISEQCE